jgi:nicotinate phosphoribosyltransferase
MIRRNMPARPLNTLPPGALPIPGLAIDLYELTMAASYFENRKSERAAFSLFVRDYPPGRRYFVSAGLEDVLGYLRNLSFGKDDIDYVKSLGLFTRDFLTYLREFKFTGDVFAIPEGRLFFADEPVLEVEAPLIEAQLVETCLINVINLQAMIATKASRCLQAAGPRRLVDFSLRRTQGIEAGLKVARASFIGGFVGTSNVLAGRVYGLPVFGTMAHSFVTSFEREIDAFRAYARSFPQSAVLLIDTYDTLAGAAKAAAVGKEMSARGEGLRGVRLDSGDIAGLSRKVRQVLVQAGLGEASILASGALDELKIAGIIRRGGDVDSFGVGTRMGVSADAPYLDMAYKMVELAGRPVLKLSPGKTSLAGRKQIFRLTTPSGSLKRDVIGLRKDDLPGEPLLRKAMEGGEIVGRCPSLPEIQKTFLAEFANLDEKYRRLDGGPPHYPVSHSPRLRRLQAGIIRKIRGRELRES